MIDNSRLLEALPFGCLPRSSLVDALHLAAGTKEVLRTRLLDGCDVKPILDWCKASGLVGKADEDRFVFLRKTRGGGTGYSDRPLLCTS